MMKAADIMTNEVATILCSATVAEAISVMKKKGVGALIVPPSHTLDTYGIITETEIVYKVAAFEDDPNKIRVYEIMTKPCTVVAPDLDVKEVARLFANRGINKAPVIQNEVLGIISVTDILNKSDLIEQFNKVSLQKEIDQAIEDARTVSLEKGINSQEAAAAWDIVEELQAEAAHQRTTRSYKTAFNQYCEENPEAVEALMYEV